MIGISEDLTDAFIITSWYRKRKELEKTAMTETPATERFAGKIREIEGIAFGSRPIYSSRFKPAEAARIAAILEEVRRQAEEHIKLTIDEWHKP